MEKERQGPRPQPGRAAANGNRRPQTTPVRPYAAPTRPYQSTQRRNAAAPPPPYVPPAQPGRYPPSATLRKRSATPPRKRPAAPRSGTAPLSAQKRSGVAQPSGTPKTKEELAEERFRDALWPQTRETPRQRRTAFLLSLLYALIHILCSFLLIYPLNVLTARMPFPVADITRAFLSALAGTALCSLTRLRFPDEPRMMLLAYRRLLREVLIIFIALQALLWGEWGAQRMIARFALKFAVGPLVVGTAVAVLLFYLDWLYIEVDDEDA